MTLYQTRAADRGWIQAFVLLLIGIAIGIIIATGSIPIGSLGINASDGVNVSVDNNWTEPIETSNSTDSEPVSVATGTPGPEADEDGLIDWDGVDKAYLEQKIHERINEVRVERGLNPLNMEPKLREAARLHSGDMAQNGYFAHESPDGEDFEDRYAEVGYSCRVPAGNGYLSGGENIASLDVPETNETELAAEFVEMWMNSPGHRENILDPAWGNEGIGVAIRDEIYVTQNFC